MLFTKNGEPRLVEQVLEMICHKFANEEALIQTV